MTLRMFFNTSVYARRLDTDMWSGYLRVIVPKSRHQNQREILKPTSDELLNCIKR